MVIRIIVPTWALCMGLFLETFFLMFRTLLFGTVFYMHQSESCRSDSFSSSYQRLDYRQGHFCSNIKRI